VQPGKPRNALIALPDEVDFNLAPINRPTHSSYQFRALTPSDQRNNVVVPLLQPLGQFANRGPLPPRKALQLQQKW
jgi:hypothetical protein